MSNWMWSVIAWWVVFLVVPAALLFVMAFAMWDVSIIYDSRTWSWAWLRITLILGVIVGTLFHAMED